jgi:drug/metabolite transporter (DMT)-like permease
MTLLNIMLLALYSFGMAAGQILFKMSSAAVKKPFGFSTFRDLMFNGYFVAAIILYMVMTVVWVWVLTKLPLSVAYPFSAFVFVIVPLLALGFLGEPLRWTTMAGAGVIIAGIYISSL